MASNEPFLFCPLGCLSFCLWPLMTPFSFVHWVVCPSSLYGLWWPLSLLSIGLSLLLLFMASDEPFLFSPLGCLSFSLWPLMTPFSFVHWVVCPSLYGLGWALSLLSIGLSVLFLLMTSDDPFLFCPLGCLSFFSLWPLMTSHSFIHWVVCPSSIYGLWWTLSLLSDGLSVFLLFMTSDEPILFYPLGCLSSIWPLVNPLSFVHWVVCPSLYDLWWPLSLLSIGLSVLFMASDEPSLFCPLGCLSFFSLWPLMTPFSFVYWVVCPSSLYDLWWHLSLLSIRLSVFSSLWPLITFSVLLFMTSDDPSLFFPLGCLSFFSLWPLITPLSFVVGFSVLLLFVTSDDPFLFGPLGYLSFSLWPLMSPLSLVHWVVSPSSLYGLWWPLSLLSIGLSVSLFMASDEPILFFPLGCLSFSLWPLMTPLSFVHSVVCPSLYGLWWTLSLWSIGLSVLLFMASDDPFSFVHWVVYPSLYGLWWPLSLFAHWVVCPSSLYGLWWPLSLLYIGLSVLIFMVSDEPFLFCPLGCLFFFSLWTLMTPFSFIHWVVCPSSLYDLWWPLSLLSVGFSVLLLFVTSHDPFLFGPLGCLSFSLWPLMSPLSLVHWVVSPSSLYGLWWPLSLLFIGLSVSLFMASDEPILFFPLGCLSFSLWPLMTPLSFVHWVVCPSLYGLWWTLSLWSIGLSVLLFMASDDPFSFVHWVVYPSLYGLWWPLSLFAHWVVCPSSLYRLWWPLSILSIGLSVLIFMVSDEPFLFCPLGCLFFFSLWTLMTPFSFIHWVVCPSSLYDLWWPLSLLSVGFSVLLLFVTSHDPFLFGPLGCLSFSVWPLMTPLSLVHWVVSPSSLYGLWWPLSLLSIGLSVPLFMASDEPILFCPLGCLSFFSLWPLMTPFSFIHWVICSSPLYGLW